MQTQIEEQIKPEDVVIHKDTGEIYTVSFMGETSNHLCYTVQKHKNKLDPQFQSCEDLEILIPAKLSSQP